MEEVVAQGVLQADVPMSWCCVLQYGRVFGSKFVECRSFVSTTTINRRYILHEQLGAGGMGAVYRALDRLTNTAVALKRVVIPADAQADSHALHRALADEFQVLASLRHPHIIPVLDYGFDEGIPFFTMRYLPNARTFTQAAQDTDDVGKLTLLIQLLHALAYVHRRNMVHRDIKPENVLVDEEDHLYLLDFGLATHKSPHAERIAGTLAYIPPEVLRQRPATPASDLYAVGLMGYVAFAGAHPFNIENPEQLIVDIFKKRPDFTLFDHAPGIRLVLERLLRKQPDERLADALAVMEMLRPFLFNATVIDDLVMSNSFLQAAPFAGREAELATLDVALERAQAGQGAIWLVGGESGVGKTRLLEELRIRAMLAGVLVLRGQGAQDSGVPYEYWADAVHHLALNVPLVPLEASILQEVAPRLGQLLDYPIDPAPEVDMLSAQKRLITHLIALFKRYGKPLVLLLDDLHHAHESLQVLQQFSSIIGDLPLLILGAYRTDERPTLPDDLPIAHTLLLQRLKRAEIATLSEAMLGETGRQPQVLELLQKETDGNVFFLVETVRALAEDAGSLMNVGRQTLPAFVFAGGVMQVVERRLAQLTPDHMPTLQLAAVIGQQVDTTLLRYLTGQDIETWLTACANSAILVVQGGRWQFAHSKLRDGVLQTLAESDHRNLSRRVAQGIEAIYPHNEALAAVLADHWQRAGDPLKEARYCYLAGRQLSQSAQPHSALHMLQRARRLLQPAAPLQQPIAQLLGHVNRDMSEHQQAAIHYRESLHLATAAQDDAAMAGALNGLGQLALRSGHYPEAEDYFRESLTKAEGTQDQRLIAENLSFLGATLMHRGEYEAARTYLVRSLELAQSLDNLQIISHNYNRLGSMAYRQGDVHRARDFFNKALTIRRTIGMWQGVAASLNNLAIIAMELQDYAEAMRQHQESYQMKKDIGDRYGMGYSLTNMGITALVQEDYATARTHFEEAMILSRQIGDQEGLADNLANIGLVIRRMDGDLAQARTYLEEGAALSRKIGDRLGLALALSNLGDVLLKMRDDERAYATLQEALAVATAIRATQPTLRSIIWLGRYWALHGRVAYGVALWSFVLFHEACDADTRRDAEGLFNTEHDLSAVASAEAIAKGREMTLPQVVGELLDDGAASVS